LQIRKKFEDESFAVPEVVFWNVGMSKALDGVALVSGYSKKLVRLFLEADGVLSPEYDNLQVLD
jgi:hypothetical protein